jgi:hypothetical protein
MMRVNETPDLQSARNLDAGRPALPVQLMMVVFNNRRSGPRMRDGFDPIGSSQLHPKACTHGEQNWRMGNPR